MNSQKGKVNGGIVLMFSIIHIVSSSVTYVDGYYKPEIIYDYTINFERNISIKDFQANPDNIQILTTQQQVITFNAEAYDPNGTNIISTLSNISNQKISGMYVQEWPWMHINFLLDQIGTVYYYDMSSKMTYFQFPTNATNNNSIFVTGMSIFVLDSFQSALQTAIVYRYDRLSPYSLKQIIQTNVTGIVQMKAFDDYGAIIQQTIVLWNSTGFIQVINCTFSCSQMYQLQQNNKTINNLILLGGYTMIVDYNNIHSIQVYSLIYDIDYASINYNQTILSLQFSDAWLKNFGAFYSNNSLVIYQAWGSAPFTYIYQYDNFPQLTNYSWIDYTGYKIYVPFQDKLECYKIVCPSNTYMITYGLCAKCDVNCQVCDKISGICSICKSSYYLNTGICYYQNTTINNTINQTINNATNNTINVTSLNNIINGTIDNTANNNLNITLLKTTINSTINSTTNSILGIKYLNNTINSTANNTIISPTNSSFNTIFLNNTINNTINQTISNSTNSSLNNSSNLTNTQNRTSNSSIKLQNYSTNNQQSFQEKIMLNLVSNTINVTTAIVGKAFLILQIAPLAWLFLQFINYWNICSFYILINISMPDYLNGFLTQIYNAVNASVFQQLGINLQLNLSTPQLVNNQNLLKYQITSNFLSDNFQGIVLILFICFSLILVQKMKNLLPNNNWFYKQLKLDNFLIIMGQYVPLMSSVFLPISFIYNHSNYSDISQKTNLSLNLSFVGISILVPFLLLAYFQIVKKNRLSNKNKKKNQLLTQKKQLNLEQYNWFFYSIINISISFVISFQNPQLFLICNFICFTFGIYLSFKTSIRRMNNVILSCHIFFFHIGFIGIFLSNSYSNQLYHYFASLTLFFFFIGAIHQIFTIIIQSIIKIYQFIKKTRRISPNAQIKSQRDLGSKDVQFNQLQKSIMYQVKMNRLKPKYKVSLKNNIPLKLKPQNRGQMPFSGFRQNYQKKQNIPNLNLNTKKNVSFAFSITKRHQIIKMSKVKVKKELIIKYIDNDNIM